MSVATERYSRSQADYAAARDVIPGGVNSPVRAFRGVGGTPIFFERGQGAYVWDVDGNRYIDYVLSWGPLLLGHAHPAVVEAITLQAQRGTSFGAPTELETELARLVIELVPSIEQIRFVNSGTEATMSALRLARAATGRRLIVKFNGCYHGHADMLLVQAGSGVATLGLPDSPGVPPSVAAETITIEYNDLDAAAALFANRGDEIAAVIVEPIAANMGFVLPKPGFLSGLRELTQAYGAIFILDEVMTGFRVAAGGAQALWGLDPDLTCLGKVIGGGLPVGAYAGKRQFMQLVAPAGPMYQAGTLSGNPLAMIAGLTTLRTAFGGDARSFQQAVTRTARLADGLRMLGERYRIPVQVGNVGTMFGCYFLRQEGSQITSYAEAKAYADPQRYARFFWAMADQGIYLAPSQFEAGFLSTAHTDADIDETLAAAEVAFAELASAE
ncbi:glutamate-1-semialdehyde 2,1-aminomutase [Chloroflexus sp.]|uniref:glutamate-1-semialdehyde 2,1-aminomutase n=1 Tax=Chloroflexus sp. TaxID=1904827 RepID=UPI002ADE4070|nr:glutamate-1-semialdehyde 2,1-aminomutase [Chloroflexus sp.]